jgi:hypothetical protein
MNQTTPFKLSLTERSFTILTPKYYFIDSIQSIHTVMLFHQDGHYSAVVLLLKAALIQVSDYRLLGASCFA